LMLLVSFVLLAHAGKRGKPRGFEKRDVMFHHLNKSITEPSWGSYTGRKVADMMRLPAFFAASADRPSGYNDRLHQRCVRPPEEPGLATSSAIRPPSCSSCSSH